MNDSRSPWTSSRGPANPKNLSAACAAIARALAAADTACALPGRLVERLGLQRTLTELIDRSGLRFATMFADKSVLDEQHPGYVGMYCGRLMNEPVRRFVESCDQVVRIGTAMTDFNSGAFTACLHPDRVIDIGHHQTQVGSVTFDNVELEDVLTRLAATVTTKIVGGLACPTTTRPVISTGGNGNGTITADVLYECLGRFFAPGNIIVAETGTAAMGLAFITLPTGANFLNQTLWGSIGWATPAALGAAIARPDSRVILITGEGSHQFTAQEITQFARLSIRPIVFVLNNGGYLIERLLCRDPSAVYNGVPQWNYTQLPQALGCDGWFTARVSTNKELDIAMHTASTGAAAAYIEILTAADAAPVAAQRLREHADSLYSRGGSPLPGGNSQ